MKPPDIKRIIRAVRAVLPELQEKGRLLVAIPRGRILRGIYLEDSSDPSRFYVWTFVQPLYVPASIVSFNLGKRLGGPSKTWNISEPDVVAVAIRDEGYKFFEHVSSPEALANWSFLDGRSDFYAVEARAYSLVASGQFAEGAQALRELAGALAGETPWMIEMQQQAERLADLAEKDPHEAQKLLTKWEAETASALRIQNLP